MHTLSKTFAVALLASTSLTAPALAQITSTYFGGNLLINPWMEIDQVSEGTTVTQTGVAAGTFTLHKRGDGWYTTDTVNTTVSLATAFQTAAIAPDGSIDDLLYSVSTASSTAAVLSLETIEQPIEPSKLAALQYGTANAQPSYLSFCAKASVAGTYSFYIAGGTSALTTDIGGGTTGSSYFQTFSVPTAAQWSCYSFVIPGDTGGTWLTNTAVHDATHGAVLGFVMGANGAVFATTQSQAYTAANCVGGAWINAASSSTSGCVATGSQVILSKTAGATFELTGVKWSLDQNPLVHSPQQELLDAQRYFNKTFKAGVGGLSGVSPSQNACAAANCPVGAVPASGNASVAANAVGIVYNYPVTMAVAPTVTVYALDAATTQCTDMVTTASVSTSTIEPNLASHTVPGDLRKVYVSCAGPTNATGDQVGIHVQADGRLN